MLFFAWKAPRQNSLTSSTKTSGSELTDIRGVAGGGGGEVYLTCILFS